MRPLEFAFSGPNHRVMMVDSSKEHRAPAGLFREQTLLLEEISAMAKPGRKLKKANHGRRPANAKARKAKRKAIKT